VERRTHLSETDLIAEEQCAVPEIGLKLVHLASIQGRRGALANPGSEMTAAGYRSEDAGMSPIKPGSNRRTLDIL
jgi:hypothetical protein